MSSSSSSASSADGAVTFDRLPPRWEPTPVIPQRPLGVAVLAVLIALFALVLLLAGVFFLLASYFGPFVPSSLEVIPSLDVWGAAIVAILGAALLGVATALWNQETWALWTTIVLVFATTTYLFFTESITVLLLIFIVLFVYLISVRRYFY
ncbi:MAG TPA: hypothetical protein VMC82_00350 [Thermoplasmata archaeon]|nr:hypothetical protein [Thermoplasmata archaeon]